MNQLKRNFLQTHRTEMPRSSTQEGQSSLPSTQQVTWDGLREAITRSSVAETGTAQTDTFDAARSAIGADRIYPHLYDQESATGQAMSLVEKAVSDVRDALDAFDRADLQNVGSCMAALTAVAARAQSHADFNRSFRAVLGFVRRAALVADAADLKRSTLNAMLAALIQLSLNPTLDLMSAAEMTEGLAREGWHGEHQRVEALVQLLLGESEAGGEDATQSDLFVHPVA